MSLLNCPNCGAPIQKDYCSYCGSVFLDWACFDLNNQFMRDSYGYGLAQWMYYTRKALMYDYMRGRPTFVKIKKENGDIVLEANGLEVDGVVGPKTWKKLLKLRPRSIRVTEDYEETCFEVAELGDKLIRNEILTPNEMRGILGFKPSSIQTTHHISQ